MQFSKRWATLSLMLVLGLVMSTMMTASAASTTKKLSSNFTLVNLAAGKNDGNIQYFKADGTSWRADEAFSLPARGDQIIKRQYDDASLASGRGSVVVSSEGQLGAVVQVQARDGQVPTSGAYSGVSQGASKVYVPLVSRRGTSASGMTNSQIVIQNAGGSTINVEVDLISLATGTSTHKRTGISIAPSASFEYDLDDENNLPVGWFGSAVVEVTTAGGQVAVVSNFFTGPHAMQTVNGFANTAQKWFAPLFTSRLANSLSTPVTVQNLSGGSIPANGINMTCKKGDGSPDPATFTKTNPAPVQNNASYAFNPVVDLTIPAAWYGSCVVTTTGFNTAMFVQMRFVTGDRAAAYEGIPAGGTNTTAVIPLYAKRLANGFASAVTIQNLNEGAAANVTLTYKGGQGAAANCTLAPFNANIPAGGSLIQNHRIEAGPNSVPSLPNGCFGTLTVTSNQPIDSFVQLDFLNSAVGDPYMAHNGFTVN